MKNATRVRLGGDLIYRLTAVYVGGRWYVPIWMTGPGVDLGPRVADPNGRGRVEGKTMKKKKKKKREVYGFSAINSVLPYEIRIQWPLRTQPEKNRSTWLACKMRARLLIATGTKNKCFPFSKRFKKKSTDILCTLCYRRNAETFTFVFIETLRIPVLLDDSQTLLYRRRINIIMRKYSTRSFSL